MSQRKRALTAGLEVIIRDKAQISQPQFLDAYDSLSRSRGKGCADGFATLARLYAPREDFGDLADDLARLIDGHPPLVAHQIKVAIYIILGFGVLSGIAKLMGSTALDIVRVTGVAGLALLVLFYLFKPLMEKTLLPKLGRESAEKLIHRIAIFVFIIALLAVLCWGSAEVIRAVKGVGSTTTTTPPRK